jgi:hypothetical protein
MHTYKKGFHPLTIRHKLQIIKLVIYRNGKRSLSNTKKQITKRYWKCSREISMEDWFDS